MFICELGMDWCSDAYGEQSYRTQNSMYANEQNKASVTIFVTAAP
ncbi:hypothetical protein [Anabaena sphaerica]|nr:hypothetical protein [Anabaena sphaerica]